MGARLIWRDSQGQQGTVDLAFGEIFIGRNPECAIRTDDPMVSRRHARVFFRDGRHVIEDLGSANGVFVGEVRTPSHGMSPGEDLRCGSLWIRYEADAPMMGPPGLGAPPPGYAPPAGFGPPPAIGGPPPAFGGPPPAFGGPPPAFGGPPPAFAPASPARGAAPLGGGAAVVGGDDVTRLQRRVEQLQAEVRILRGGGERALKFEELEAHVAKLEQERNELQAQVRRLEDERATEAGDIKVRRASAVIEQAEDIVNGLNDVISELRINVMAAEGEVEQWAGSVPQAAFELVRESLRSCRSQLEVAKGLLRQLRDSGRA